MQKDESTIVGIDFGTTGLRVAAMMNGKPVILENEEGEGTSPAYIAFDKAGNIQIGEAARLMGEYTLEVAWAIKRLVGRRWDDPIVRAIRAATLYPMVQMDDGKPGLMLAGRVFSPLELCSHLFAGLRLTASRHLSCNVSQAVLAVPAHFGLDQRRALQSAAAAAGLEILRFVPEPTAAALYHGLGDKKRTVAIYDLGGGTFDISILEIDDGVFEVLASDGDPLIGGEDFDLRVRDHILERSGLNAEDLSLASRYRVKRAAEGAKIALSGRLEHRIVEAHLTTIGGQPVALDLTITREQLRGLCQDLVDRTLAVCARAVEGADRERKRLYRSSDAGFTLDEVTEVILVGGATRLPFVETDVERYFGKPLVAPLRREDAVALGCAVQAGVLSGLVRDTLLLDVASRDYGVRIGNVAATPLLGRNTTIPTKQSLVMEGAYDSGTLEAAVVEFDRDGGETTVTAVHVAGAGREAGRYRLRLTLDVDANGLLRFDVADLISDYFGSVRAGMIDTVEAHAPSATSSDSAPFPKQSPPPVRVPSAGARILAIGTEWRSGAGGLSSLNRHLCYALAADGHDVICLVLDADPSEFAAAAMRGVRLVKAVRGPGQSDQVALIRKPSLPENWMPELIIGHGRITGPAAAALAEDHFSKAKRLHVIHMAPDEIEWFKLDRGDDAGVRAEERTRIERELGTRADFVAAVGPRLHGRFLTDLHPAGRTPFRLDPGFDGTLTPPLGVPPGHPLRILLVGRTEDETLKGLDIAARAVGLLHSRWSGPSLSLNVRGARAGTSEALREKLLAWAGVAGLMINVSPYDTVAEHLDSDYRSASLVLMPSRSEGFGLVGLEAIGAGVPVLVSAESGLGELLHEQLPAEIVNRIVIPVKGNLAGDAESWSHAIERVLLDRNSAFASASTMLHELRSKKSWAKTASEIRDKIWS